ncbi:C4-dicarboxylate ABC transporter permease [Lamprobacter modestohalophilus]|uniref:TRAP transporter small permease protein n=1 Tax=Lamprobacter modestohalophilus TaxID=1064514 RepID=A0A9X0W6R9_9GAMM|nr:TRAP transporter small permease subunit [Lamprobacter modestohalophilus]MBK1618024.1 C4-dicarboxylate ABC transporter permease [Lamprobacter modestohalophilus]
MNQDSSSGPKPGLLRVAEHLEWINHSIGALVAWLALAMVLMTFVVVVLRYVFDSGSIALQESVTYMYAILFMLGAAYTLQQDGHVRVDILYQRFSRRGRAWVNLLGTLFLLVPVSVFLLLSSWGYVADSWAVKEGSREAGGLPGVWLLKTLLLVMPALMLVQGLIWVLRNGLFLAGVDAALADPDEDSARVADSAAASPLKTNTDG